MGQFNFDRKEEAGVIKVSFGGHLDEDANFSQVDVSTANNIELNLESVVAINSCGIREWIKWIKSAPPTSRIRYRNCPKVIVDQINMVAGFLPENAKVESFFVPYFADGSGEEKMVLFTRGKEFDDGRLTPPEEVKDSGGKEMEMDVIEAKYFKFLNLK